LCSWPQHILFSMRQTFVAAILAAIGGALSVSAGSKFRVCVVFLTICIHHFPII
jgi:hypothetical protein